jgi:hypothetical protein
MPSDQPVNKYSPCGVAVTETVCPFLYSPPEVLTLPPSPAERVIVYLAIGSLTGAEVSSDEQDNINKNIVTMESSFFIRRHLEYKYIVFKPIPILSQYDKSISTYYNI